MNLYKFSYLFTLLLFLGFLACDSGSNYRQLVKEELASGERHDSIFLGFYLGMPNKDFFDRCWNLNKEGLVRQGNQNTTVNFQMDILGEKTDVDFYPDFYQDKIYQMKVTYKYWGWSPWLKHLNSEALMYRLLAIYEKSFGGEFMEIKSPDNRIAFVKVDGNRRISIYQKDEHKVRVIFTDLILEKMVKKNKPQLATNKEEQVPVWWDKLTGSE
jgi:hypothetical protein